MEFQTGDAVRRRSAPDQVGVVREARWNEQLEEYVYRVQFGAGVSAVGPGDLEPLPTVSDPWQELAAGSVEGVDTFRRLLTFERLNRPASRVAASFGTARAMLLPYQFKPLLKFLESPGQRLLIADDVGLGKTIEAGYILKELKARVNVERTLCVVPARLASKWKTEFERRFDETFEIVSRRQLMEGFLEPVRRGADPPSFQWITSYESARAPEVVRLLEELQPSLDLVIFDEAHRLRNPDTNQSLMGKAIAGCSDALVLLTATPIQTGKADLFQLLRLLDPVTFSDLSVFERQLEANRPVVRALTAIRQTPPDAPAALAELEKLAGNPLTEAVTRGEFFQSVIARLQTPGGLDRHTAVELQRDISELSLTAHALSRTRKAEVMPNRPQRRAAAVKVTLSPEEWRVYKAVAGFALVMGQGLGWGGQMALTMMFRYTASCIPAALEHFRQAAGGRVQQMWEELQEEFDADESAEPGKAPSENWQKFVAGIRDVLEVKIPRDSKLEKLLETLETIWRDDASASRLPRKVIVFAYFKRTVEYVANALVTRGISTKYMHGAISVTDREAAIDAFLSDPSVRVLVSSEVGSEGLDMQQASVVVNYDLPWNPMVVEQRIGRVDRLGQESPVITIESLVLANTIEDKILYRLYERLGVFTETIGEIEPILGEQIEKLALESLRGDLTPEEEARRVEQTANALRSAEQEAARLNRGADQLIAGDQAFLDEVESLVGERRVPAPSELFAFLREFIRSNYPGSTVPATLLQSVADLHLQPGVGRDLLLAFAGDADARRVASKVQQGPFPATMNADAFLRRPRCELVTVHHPLIRLAKRSLEAHADTHHRAFAVRLSTDGAPPTGQYLMAVVEYSISGARERRELVPVVWPVGGDGALETTEARRLFVRILDDAASDETFSLQTPANAQSAMVSLRAFLERLRADTLGREVGLSAARLSRRRATQEATLQARVTAAEGRLESLRQRGAADFPIRMAEARLKAERTRLDVLIQQFATPAVPRLDERELAILYVTVE